LRSGVYVRRSEGSSVIDYVLVNESICNKVCRFRIGDRVDSDHIRINNERKEKKRTKENTKAERKEREENRDDFIE